MKIRKAFAMTINKAQGQTLEKVAIWLEEHCFGHGQFLRQPEGVPREFTGCCVVRK